MLWYDHTENAIVVPEDEPAVATKRENDLEEAFDKIVAINKDLDQKNRELSVEVADLRRQMTVLGVGFPSKQQQKTIFFDASDAPLVESLLAHFWKTFRQVPLGKRRSLKALVLLFDEKHKDDGPRAVEQIRLRLLRGQNIRVLAGVEEKKEELCG